MTYTPLLINMTLDQKGILPCYFEASPPVQYVSWTKDRRLFDPFDEDGIQVLTNGSVLIKKVSNDVYLNLTYEFLKVKVSKGF